MEKGRELGGELEIMEGFADERLFESYLRENIRFPQSSFAMLPAIVTTIMENGDLDFDSLLAHELSSEQIEKTKQAMNLSHSKRGVDAHTKDFCSPSDGVIRHIADDQLVHLWFKVCFSSARFVRCIIDSYLGLESSQFKSFDRGVLPTVVNRIKYDLLTSPSAESFLYSVVFCINEVFNSRDASTLMGEYRKSYMGYSDMYLEDKQKARGKRVRIKRELGLMIRNKLQNELPGWECLNRGFWNLYSA